MHREQRTLIFSRSIGEAAIKRKKMKKVSEKRFLKATKSLKKIKLEISPYLKPKTAQSEIIISHWQETSAICKQKKNK